MTKVPIRLPYGPHWNGLELVEGFNSRLRGDLLMSLQGALAATIDARGLLLVVGPAGVGKSFGVARALEWCLGRASNEAKEEWLDYATWARGYTLLRELHAQIIADGRADDLKPRQLRHDLRLALGERRRVLVVDEAQWVSTESLLVLTKFLDSYGSMFALVIIGTEELLERNKLPDVIRSRISSRIDVDPLSDSEVVPTLHDFHDIFTTANTQQLRYVNRTRALGELRWWAQFLTAWWQMHRQVGYELGDEVMAEIAAMVPSTARDKKRRRRAT